MQRLKTTVVATAFVCCLFAKTSYAQTTVTCPPGPNQLTAKVTSQVAFDSATKMYTYVYTISNDPGSLQEIKSFDLDFAPPISNLANPRGWVHAKFTYRSTLGWNAVDVDDIPVSAGDGNSVPPALTQIKPGQSVAGFSFQSPKPPGPVKYFLTGYVSIPKQPSEEAAETMVEQCQQSVLNQDTLDLAVVGTTQGPVNSILVQIVIKPPSTSPVSVNPRSEGVTPVAILGTPAFPVSSIDTASLRLGPGGAAPAPNQIHFEDVNGDGIIDLLTQFPTQQIGIRCNDAALFLTGKTTGGTGIQGSEELQTVGCKSDKPTSAVQPLKPPTTN